MRERVSIYTFVSMANSYEMKWNAFSTFTFAAYTLFLSTDCNRLLLFLFFCVTRLFFAENSTHLMEQHGIKWHTQIKFYFHVNQMIISNVNCKRLNYKRRKTEQVKQSKHAVCQIYSISINFVKYLNHTSPKRKHNYNKISSFN